MQKILTAIWLCVVVVSCGRCGNNQIDKKDQELLKDVVPYSPIKEKVDLRFMGTDEEDNEDDASAWGGCEILKHAKADTKNRHRRTTLQHVGRDQSAPFTEAVLNHEVLLQTAENNQEFEQMIEEYHQNKKVPEGTNLDEFKKLCKQYKDSHDIHIDIADGRFCLPKKKIEHTGQEALYMLCLRGIWTFSDMNTRAKKLFEPQGGFEGWRVRISLTNKKGKTFYSIVVPLNLFVPVNKKSWSKTVKKENCDDVKYLEWVRERKKPSSEMKFAPRIILLEEEAKQVREHIEGVRLRFFDRESKERGVSYCKVRGDRS